MKKRQVLYSSSQDDYYPTPVKIERYVFFLVLQQVVYIRRDKSISVLLPCQRSRGAPSQQRFDDTSIDHSSWLVFLKLMRRHLIRRLTVETVESLARAL